MCASASRSTSPVASQRVPRSLMFTQLQTCQCTGWRQPLCPFHGALRIAIRRACQWSQDTFFCSGSAVRPSKRQVARLAQVVGFCLYQRTGSHLHRPVRSTHMLPGAGAGTSSVTLLFFQGLLARSDRADHLHRSCGQRPVRLHCLLRRQHCR